MEDLGYVMKDIFTNSFCYGSFITTCFVFSYDVSICKR